MPTTASRGVDRERADLRGAASRRRPRRAPAPSRRSSAPPATSATTRPGSSAERRLALDGVDEREPARRPGADVDEPAAAREPRRDRVDRGGERAAAPLRPRAGTVASAVAIRRDELRGASGGRGRRPPDPSPRSRARRAARLVADRAPCVPVYARRGRVVKTNVGLPCSRVVTARRRARRHGDDRARPHHEGLRQRLRRRRRREPLDRATASSSSSSGRPAAGSRRSCAWSPGSRR